MKKFLVVAFCLVVGTSVSAQEEAVVGDVQDLSASIVAAPETESTVISAPQESETPAPVVVAQDLETTSAPEVVIAPEVVVDAAVVEGTSEMIPLTEATVVSGGYVDAAPCTGCGQTLPVMNYDAGLNYNPVMDYSTASYAQAAPCTGCGSAVTAAPAYTAPAYDAGYVAYAATPVNACCDSGANSPQVITRVRGRVSARTSLRDRWSSRRNPCCN